MEDLKETTVVPIRTVQEHLTLILRKWDGLDRAGEKYKSVRLDLALELKALRERIEAGEDETVWGWWDWYDANCRRSRKDAEKLLAIADAVDPQAAYEAAKAKNAANNQAYRERLKSLPLSLVTGKGEQNQSPAHVSGTVVQAGFATSTKRPMATVPRYVSGPDDDELVVQIMVLFRRLSWNGIQRALTEATKFCDRKHRGLE